ncbi:Shufflon protein B', partial [Pseudolycoriella hygida]
MKLIVVLSLICLALVMQKVAGELVRADNIAFRWPTATATCPPGKKMLSGGGNCRDLGGQGWLFLVQSSPISENSYRVRCDTPKEQNVMAEAFIICE